MRALTVTSDGIVWGLCGEPAAYTNLFSHDAETGEMADEGSLGYSVSSLAADESGRLYIGESKFNSVLVVVHPDEGG